MNIKSVLIHLKQIYLKLIINLRLVMFHVVFSIYNIRYSILEISNDTITTLGFLKNICLFVNLWQEILKIGSKYLIF